MKILIAGSGVSGKSAKNFFDELNISSEFVKDEDINSGENFKDKTYAKNLFSGVSLLVLSPGISHSILLVKTAREFGVKITGEFGLGAKYISGDVIAVTGTNGKTTTVSLINFLLTKNRLESFSKKSGAIFLGGNIGIPVTSFATKTKKNDISVLEVSSFQLEDEENFHPHIACILNITPDHLVRHKLMQNYIDAKLNIAKNLTEKDFLLINADSPLLIQNLPKTNAKIYYFSTKQEVVGCYLKDDCIYFKDNENEKNLISIGDIKLVGEHNKSNILASVLSVYLETGSTRPFRFLKDFESVEHRIEYVCLARGISFYNDSKATNIDSTLVALSSFNCGINLILGGSDKGYDFDALFENLPKNVKNIVAVGQTKSKIMASAKKFNVDIYLEKDIKQATIKLFGLAEFGDIILLSPACASFDQFKNYQERGRFFKKIAKEICEYETLFTSGEQAT